MDDDRFDRLTCIVSHALPRRRLAAALGLVATGPFALAAAKNKKKKRTKLKKNEYGCVNVGGKCRGEDAACCSGICDGKKPKKGQKDKSRCIAHDTGGCHLTDDTCQDGVTVACPETPTAACLRTTGNAPFCALNGGGVCSECVRDADCEALLGPGAACTVCQLICQVNEACCRRCFRPGV